MTKKQSKRGNVRRTRRVLNRCDVPLNKTGMGFFNRVYYGGGIAKQALKSNIDQDN